MNTDASTLVCKFRPKRTGFNMYTRPQLTFLALHPCLYLFSKAFFLGGTQNKIPPPWLYIDSDPPAVIGLI